MPYGHRMLTSDMLSALRSNAGLKAADLARALNVSPSHISRVETGKAFLSMQKLDEWVTACGHKLVAVRSEGLLAAWADLDPADAEFFEDVLRAWRLLSPDARDRLKPVLRSMLAAWVVK